MTEDEEERKKEAPLSKTAKSVLEDLFSDKSGQFYQSQYIIELCILI